MSKSINKNEIFDLILKISDGRVKISTDDSRNWFEIIDEISSYMVFTTDDNHIIYIHNDCNTLGDIVGIRKIKNLNKITDEDFVKVLDNICNDRRTLNLPYIEQNIGSDNYFNFINAMQDATPNNSNWTEAQIVANKIKYSQLGQALDSLDVFNVQLSVNKNRFQKTKELIENIKYFSSFSKNGEIEYYCKLLLKNMDIFENTLTFMYGMEKF